MKSSLCNILLAPEHHPRHRLPTVKRQLCGDGAWQLLLQGTGQLPKAQIEAVHQVVPRQHQVVPRQHRPLLLWLSRSRDFNPIEDLWDELELQVKDPVAHREHEVPSTDDRLGEHPPGQDQQAHQVCMKYGKSPCSSEATAHYIQYWSGKGTLSDERSRLPVTAAIKFHEKIGAISTQEIDSIPISKYDEEMIGEIYHEPDREPTALKYQYNRMLQWLPAQNPHPKRHPGVHLTSLPHKDVYAAKMRGLASSRREKAVPEENKIRRAPEWVEHLSTHSKHKFTIQNLGQSEQVIRQFYKGANGGKPYVTPNPNGVIGVATRDLTLNWPLFAITAKTGKTGTLCPKSPSQPLKSMIRSDFFLLRESTTFEESVASPSQNLSSTASSGPRVIPYAIQKSVDGAVTGHSNCPPCALLAAASSSAALPEVAPSPSAEPAPSPDPIPAPAPVAPQPEAPLPEPAQRPSEPVIEVAPPPEPAVEAQRPSEQVVEVPHPSEPAVESQRPYEQVVEVPHPSEPAVEAPRPSEPVVEVPPPPEPAVEVQRPSEPVVEARPPYEATVEVAPAVMPTVSESEKNGGNEDPAPSSSYSETHEAAPLPSSSIIHTEPTPTVPPAPPVVVTTTQQAFVQQPDSGSAESSYTNLNEDHSEPQAPLIPVPAPASTYKEVKPSHETENAAGPSVPSPSYENNRETLPVESYGQNGYVAPTTAPEPELRPEAIIHPATTTLPTPEAPETPAPEAGPHYINASPAHGSEQSYSGTSQQVSYVPETSPTISAEPEPQEPATSNAEESSYNNLEEDHGQPQGPVTVIDTEKTGNTAQVNQGVSRPAYGTRPKIQVNPSSYKTIRPYAARPYVPRPALTQSVEKYKESFVPRPLPPPPGPAPAPVPAFPVQPLAPLFPPPQSFPQFSPVHQFPTYPLPQPQVLQHVPSPSYAVSQNNQSPSCCQPMMSLCCNQVVQSCCQPQQQVCCNAQINWTIARSLRVKHSLEDSV
ncbi:hypothetical protein TELCIR_11214 [Teladorsagia circumcincta]|uniref:Uncharacterized protein n=1 Tax=Teladorsagia circumcincta TaxID=45464 RepID=A0A2G9U9X8_TELCI|nr:hypothetical protein TELCIR_11214 [Teladorsagia circumcincta]